MFQAAAATLRELAKNPEYVGSSRLGFTGVLHTWGRTLSYNPHLHFIVPGRALSEDGQEWLPSRVDFFVPVRAASLIYRAKFLELMASAGLLDQVPQAAREKSWVVHILASAYPRRDHNFRTTFEAQYRPRRLASPGFHAD